LLLLLFEEVCQPHNLQYRKLQQTIHTARSVQAQVSHLLWACVQALGTV
jgi:hypothetical protein